MTDVDQTQTILNLEARIEALARSNRDLGDAMLHYQNKFAAAQKQRDKLIEAVRVLIEATSEDKRP
jgi:hypothetical protein